VPFTKKKKKKKEEEEHEEEALVSYLHAAYYQSISGKKIAYHQALVITVYHI
jgi:hypothetical protein